MYKNNRIALSDKFADELGVPTPERLEKSDFAIGKVYKVVSTVDALLSAGAIDDAEAKAAYRLRKDLLFAREGYHDPHPRTKQTALRHDQISWQMTRAQAGARVNRIRDLVRPTIFELLTLMLAEEMSFSSIAKMLIPGSDVASARKKASAQCALALKVLHETYQDLASERRHDAAATIARSHRDVAWTKQVGR